MFKRLLDLDPILERKSLFLFGPRQVGKTTYLRERFPEALFFDLLNMNTFRDLSVDPGLIEKTLSAKKSQKRRKIVVIDEIQKMPELLNEIHRLIEKHKDVRFILTGSSARKLKRAGVNMLGGRASEVRMHPCVWPELSSGEVEFSDYLQNGGLPFVIESSAPVEDLNDYVSLYLQREIREEGLVKNFMNFSRFLDFAALTSGELINFTSLGSDAQLPPRTVQDYYQILEDTLVGSLLSPYQKTRRKPISTAKFFLFDMGLANFFNQRADLRKSTEAYGKALEHLIFSELSAYCDYSLDHRNRIFFWRTQTQVEVDFVLETSKKTVAIEVKATARPSKKMFGGLKAIIDENPKITPYLVCSTKAVYQEGPITVIDPQSFLKRLWAKKL
jgi:predicted AAA+ superfamily ATPase